MRNKYGISKLRFELLGTGLFLNKGERVKLIRATNIPDGENQYFASPAKKRKDWLGNGLNSILLDLEDFEFCD